jgi:hypothetical protein
VAVLVVVLVVTNLLTLAALLWTRFRPASHEQPDERLASAARTALRPVGTPGSRRVITVEILNPIELAGSRGRVAGVAGSLVPGLIRRVVYDQAVREIRRTMREHQVVADVRLLEVRREVTYRPAQAASS